MVVQELEEPTDSWSLASLWGSTGNCKAFSVTKIYRVRLMPGTFLGTGDTDQNPALVNPTFWSGLNNKPAKQSMLDGAKCYREKQAGRDKSDGRLGAS